jgi:hypothetical protein
MKSLLQFLLLILLSGLWQQSKRPGKEWSFDNNIGLAMSHSGKTCLSIHNTSLAPGSGIRLVGTEPPQKESDAQVFNVDKTCPEVDTGARRYELRADVSNLASAMPVIAVVGFSGKFDRHGELITADLDGDGTGEYFRSCTSTEGIHFTIWSGYPLSGKLRWHKYYYLGYDVSPTCTEKETDLPR